MNSTEKKTAQSQSQHRQCCCSRKLFNRKCLELDGSVATLRRMDHWAQWLMICLPSCKLSRLLMQRSINAKPIWKLLFDKWKHSEKAIEDKFNDAKSIPGLKTDRGVNKLWSFWFLTVIRDSEANKVGKLFTPFKSRESSQVPRWCLQITQRLSTKKITAREAEKIWKICQKDAVKWTKEFAWLFYFWIIGLQLFNTPASEWVEYASNPAAECESHEMYDLMILS